MDRCSIDSASLRLLRHVGPATPKGTPSRTMNGRKKGGELVRNSGKKQKPKTVHKTRQQEESVVTDEVCPICLKTVLPKDTAVVPGCDHSYCVYCIVRWAEDKNNALCPVCKKRFETVLTFRRLDGSIRDSKAEESICLLKKTEWYLRHTRGERLSQSLCNDVWDEDQWEDEYFDSNEIDDTEDYYFSNAAGSARIVLTNRKFGKNGYIRNGRVYAQSTQPAGELKSKSADAVTQGLATKKSDGKKTNTKGKRALRREKKKQEDFHRLA